MKIAHKQLVLPSNGKRITYHNITKEVREFVKKTKIENGICTIASPHTTCSVIFDEYTHDIDWNGDELLQVDMNRILERVIPRQLTESDYLYPGPKHVQFLQDLNQQDPSYDADPATILNADAHIRASLFGSSVTTILKKGNLLIGTVGYLYFVDWDQNRKRNRKCNMIILGE
jgi:thiamine phosphate synthase YjbQ (UPF0047 family)